MRRVLTLVAFVMFVAPAALAQHDYKKWEFFAGYSGLDFEPLAVDTDITNINTTLGGKEWLNGVEFSGTGNFHRYWGIKGDYSGHWGGKDFTFTNGAASTHSSVQNFLGGIQIKDNETEAKFKPFAHALFGFAHQHTDITAANFAAIYGLTSFDTSNTSFAGALGGGIDIRANSKIDIRVVQIDWNFMHRGDLQTGGTLLIPTPHAAVGTPFVIPGGTQNNFRFSFGVVFH